MIFLEPDFSSWQNSFSTPWHFDFWGELQPSGKSMIYFWSPLLLIWSSWEQDEGFSCVFGKLVFLEPFAGKGVCSAN